MKVATVVVTFNRKYDLIKNIEGILTQSKLVDKYYIIDNASSDGTDNLLEENGYFKNSKIKYIKLVENIGGAGGFYTGLKYAYQDGYDFICLMDDDGRPFNHVMMENIYLAASNIYETKKEIMLNPIVVSDDGEKLSFGLSAVVKKRSTAEKLSENNLFMNRINPFNGTFVSKELVQKIGFPNKDFFIKGDERDYFNRAKKSGAFIATVTNSIYYHPSMESVSINIFGRKLSLTSESPWKEYYRSRNYTYMSIKDGNIIQLFPILLKQIISAILLNKEKFNTINFIFKGCVDGVHKRLGPKVKPGSTK